MQQTSIRANAKLNWTLEVLGAFEAGHANAGYTRLRSVMLLLDLADQIDVIVDAGSGETHIECSDERVPQKRRGNQRDNSAFKAVAELRKEFSALKERDVHIRIAKRIPFAGGLGGSSADGAGVLRALNELCGLGMSAQDLAEIAARFGSDAPFLASGYSAALVEGRGEQVGMLPAFPAETRFVLVIPELSLHVGDVFAALQRIDYSGCAAHRTGSAGAECAMALRRGARLGSLCRFLVNDLERSPHTGEFFRERRMFCQALRDAGCLAAQMSGSGPSVFGVCSGEQQAAEIAGKIATHFPQCRVLACAPAGAASS